MRSLPLDHPSYRNLPPMRLEDVKRSRYWYKKHHIAPPSGLGGKKPSKVIPFRMPNGSPLCGDEWLKEHLRDHTSEEIGALAIEIARGGRRSPPVSLADKKGAVKAAVRSLGDA